MLIDSFMKTLQGSINSLQAAVRILKTQLKNDNGYSLIYAGSKKQENYYLKKRGSTSKRTYCRAGSIEIKEAAQMDYYRKIKKVVEKQLKLETKLMEFLDKGSAEKFYEKLTAKRQALVLPMWKTDEQFAKEWQMQTWEIKNTYEILGNNYTVKGEKVRSKSEANIADKNQALGVPYFYEKPLKLANGKIVFPDFTLLNRKTRQEFIWEHFGMMDKEEYRTAALLKINNYAKSGYFPGINMIITYEESSIPFDSSVAVLYIKKYLL